MLSSFFENRDLMLQMLKRQIQGRYRGSQFGFIWAFIYPILMLLVYMFVFGMVMKVKWGVVHQDNVEFGLILFSGLLLHGLLAEVLMGSIGLITGNSQFVKKVVFPLHILPVVSVANALIHMLIGMLILIAAILVTGGTLHWTIIFVPLVLTPFLILLHGVSYLLSALGVYFRDLSQFMGVLVTLLMFLAPIVYPFHAIPDFLKNYVLWLNPLTVIVEQLRAVLLFGELPNWQMLGIYTVVASIALWFGSWFFSKTRDGFADVI